MDKKNLHFLLTALLLWLIIPVLISPQQHYQAPATILPEKILHLILNEISGQLAFNITR